MRHKIAVRVLGLVLLCAISAGADPIEIDQRPWSARFYGYEVSGGFMFLPAIDAATMEPLRFALAANRTGDPGPVEGNFFSPAGLSEAFGRYSEIVGSGAFGFILLAEPSPFEPVFVAPLPQYWPVQYFEAGMAPEWDPDNPPPLAELWFEEEEPGAVDPEPVPDPEEVPEEAIQAALAFAGQNEAAAAMAHLEPGDPLLILQSQLDLNTPEPATFAMVGAGVALAGWVHYRRRRARNTT